MYKKYIKRLVDIICAIAAITVFFWLYIILALLVRILLGSPILFKQKRVGMNEKIFTLYKFRTMTDARDTAGNLLPDSVRLTKFGKFLRTTSLDELPEAFNILKGDMSVVGPRPLLEEYLPYYTPEEKRRHSVRPGLSGWAQINGRNSALWEERFKYDVHYVDNCSFFTDCKIIFLTVWKVVKRSDVMLEEQKGDGYGRLDDIRKNVHIN